MLLSSGTWITLSVFRWTICITSHQHFDTVKKRLQYLYHVRYYQGWNYQQFSNQTTLTKYEKNFDTQLLYLRRLWKKMSSTRSSLTQHSLRSFLSSPKLQTLKWNNREYLVHVCQAICKFGSLTLPSIRIYLKPQFQITGQHVDIIANGRYTTHFMRCACCAKNLQHTFHY